MFKPIKYDEGQTCELPFDSGETTTKYCAVTANTGTGYYATGASGDNDVRYIALEATTTTSNGEKVLCLYVEGVKFIADTSDDPVRADDVGTYVDLNSSTKLVLGTTTDNVFYVEDIYGATTDDTVIGYFNLQPSAS